MNEEPIEVIIGGKAIALPVMPLYCLERAWPHIARLGQMGLLNQQITRARNALFLAPDGHAREQAQAALDAAELAVRTQGADYIGQTHAALDIIVAALALQTPAPSYEELAKRVQPGEFGGIHLACQQLMDASGLMVKGDLSGEAQAAGPISNGIASSLN